VNKLLQRPNQIRRIQSVKAPIGIRTHAVLRRRLLAEGLAGATVNRQLATLRSMFNQALRWQFYDGRNPAASRGMLAEQRRDSDRATSPRPGPRRSCRRR
jgi:hypothetical protein